MNNSNLLRGVALLAAVGVVALVAVLVSSSDPSNAGKPKLDGAALAVPAPPTQLRLVHAEQFQVQKPFEHLWRADRPMVNSGWLLVLEGPAALLEFKQNIEPVLYVGAQTADRVNAGASGRVVVIVPGNFRLQNAPIFLGPNALPEALDQARINAAVNAAIANGAVVPSDAEIKAAVVAGVKPYPTDFELRLRAIDLVELHSPQEKDLISGWRVPLVK